MASAKKKYTISIPVGVFWKAFVPLALLLMTGAAVAGFYFIDLFVMPRVVGIERDMVEVPAVQGLSVEQGREKFFAVGLLTEIRSRDFDNKVPEDAIISQVPVSGSKVKKGRRILVVVSKGREFSVVPDVKNMTERQARMELKKRGFLVGDTKKTFDEKQAPETVIDAFPKGGTTISRDMKVDLVLSKGPKPTSAEMPNIVGESLSEAQKKVDESGLKVGKINYRSDASLLPGTVISQSVPPGDNVPLETPVDMTVSVIQ
jgi:eukaryotic-like serine/threonine-protein kinase